MRKFNKRAFISLLLILITIICSAFSYAPADTVNEELEVIETEYFSMLEDDLPYTSPTGWKVRHRKNYKYDGYTCGDFMVFPDIYEDVTSPEIYYQGFCVDHHKGEMKNSSNVLEISEIQYDRVLKVLYYGFRDERGYYGTVLGAKYPKMSAENRAYSVVCMDMALDTIYNGSPHKVSDEFLRWCDEQPSVPTGELGFYLDNGDIFTSDFGREYFDFERNEMIHATSWINVKGSDSLSCKIDALPEEISVYLDNGDGTTSKYDSSISLRNGSRFFLGASTDYSGSYSTNLNYEEAPYKAYLTNMGDNYQRVAALMMGMSTGAGFNVSFNQATGNVSLKKVSLVKEIVDNNSNYSCVGAKYAVFRDGIIGAEIVVGEDNIGIAQNIPAGIWYVQETQASPGYEKDSNVYEVEVMEGKTVEVGINDEEKCVYENPVSYNAKLLLRKLELGTNIPLEDAEFEIKFFNICMDGNPEDLGYKHDRAWILRTDEKGEIYLDDKHKVSGDKFYYDKNGNITLPLGTLTIRETKPPKGYNKDSTINYIKVARKEEITSTGEIIYSAVLTATPDVPNEKILCPIDIVVYKEPENTSIPIEMLQGAEYTINYYDEIICCDEDNSSDWLYNGLNGNVVLTDLNAFKDAVPERSWVLKTDKSGYAKMDVEHKVSGDDFYYSEDNKAALPMGTVTIQETKAPEGFLLDSNIYVALWNEEKSEYNLVNINAQNKVINAFAHVLEKDEQKGKIAVEKTADKYIYDEKSGEFEKECVKLEGITFNIFAAEDIYKCDKTIAYNKGDFVEAVTTNNHGYAESGLLHLGKYTIKEETPEGYYPTDDIQVALDEEKNVIDITEDGITRKVVYELVSVNNVPLRPEMSTYAESNGSKLAMCDFVTKITDHVKISNIIEGREYIIHGTIMNKNTGKPVCVDGTPVMSDKIILCEKEEMIVDVEFNLNSLELAGCDIVIYEELIYEGEVVAVHKNLDDENQTIKFPEIKTYALDTATKGKSVSLKEKTVIEDMVQYNNVVPGNTYTVRGVLMDASTGNPLIIENEIIMSEASFVAEESEGTVTVEFELDGRKIKGKTLVAFEEMYYENNMIASHCDIEDENQTVYSPEISTAARDKKSGTNFLETGKEVNIIDCVSYKNLIPGLEYVVRGYVVNGMDGSQLSLANSSDYIETTFVPDSPNGIVEVEFVIDATGMSGKHLVIFEELFCAGELVAEHKDIYDEKQSLYFPEIKTKAYDKDTNKNISNPNQIVTIVDKVSYNGLIVGKKYELVGTLMDKEGNMPLRDENGCEIVSKKEFVPETSCGEVEIEFTFHVGMLEGRTIVVFERLYYEQNEIATHTDIEDEEQSIRFPAISTVATESNSGTHYTMPKDRITINDKITYSNLCKNEEYVINGILMDKATGEPLLVNGKEVTASVKFTPDYSDGEINIAYSFDANGMTNKEIVAFEELCIDNNVVGIHKNLDDKMQTIYINDNPKTGDNEKPVYAIILALLALVSMICLTTATNRKNKNRK